MKQRTAALIISVLFVLLLTAEAAAEVSTNLSVRKEINPGNKRTASETYTDAEGNPVIADDKGYATVRYTYTTGNRIGRTEYLDTEGNLVNNRDGYAQEVCVYGVGGLTRKEYLNAAGESVNGPEGYARQETKYTYGKHVSTWQYDADGNPAAGPEGYAWVEYRYSGTTPVRTAYYDASGELFYNPRAGYAAREVVYKYGKLKEIDFYGADGGLTAGPGGYAREVYTYGKQDGTSTKRIMYYNADGSLFFNARGWCGIEQGRNRQGRTVDERYFAGENERGLCAEGYSRVTWTYTRGGKITSQRYYDEKGRLTAPEKAGYAVLRNEYSGNYLTRTEYLGADRKPAAGPEGACIVGYKYEGGKLIRTSYYGADGRTPVNGKDGYARIEYTRDGNKQILSERYFDADGNRFAVRDNADEIRYTWNGSSKTSESYWADGQPVLNGKGFHEVRSEYTGGNRISAQTYLDTEGNPVTTADGYARTENQYNSKGQIRSVLYYGSGGELVNAPGKDYAYTRTVSAREMDFLGKEPEEYKEEALPGETAGPEDAEEPGGEGAGAAEETPEPDGDTLYIEYYGTDNRLTDIAAGYATIVRQTDAKGRTTGEAYFTADGKPVMTSFGYARMEREYDGKGNITLERYFGADGEKILTADGYHCYTQVFSEDGLASSLAYFGTEGEPAVNTRTLYHRIDKTYLDRYHVRREAYFDVNGKPTAGRNGFTAVEREWDEEGNLVSETGIPAE